jgi:beta-glucosidase-like glycosyl hydrolase
MNAYQAMCEQMPWGIPYCMDFDPSTGWGTDVDGISFSKKNTFPGAIRDYPFQIGYGAIGCVDYMYEHAKLHMAEYHSVGLRYMLGPMSDPLTEPRWARVYDVVGSNSSFVADMR